MEISLEDREKYISECCQVLFQQASVKDVVVINSAGNPVSSTLAPDVSIVHAGRVEEFIGKCNAALYAIDGTELDEVRIRTKKHEIYILPDQYGLTFVVTQTPLVETHLD